MYKSNYTCIFLRVCTYTLPPLPPMTTCVVIQVHKVRIFRELCTCVFTHTFSSYIHNSVSIDIFFLYPFMNTCGVTMSTTTNRYARRYLHPSVTLSPNIHILPDFFLMTGQSGSDGNPGKNNLKSNCTSISPS